MPHQNTPHYAVPVREWKKRTEKFSRRADANPSWAHVAPVFPGQSSLFYSARGRIGGKFPQWKLSKMLPEDGMSAGSSSRVLMYLSDRVRLGALHEIFGVVMVRAKLSSPLLSLFHQVIRYANFQL